MTPTEDDAHLAAVERERDDARAERDEYRIRAEHEYQRRVAAASDLRARIEALCDAADANRKEYDHIMASHVWTTDLRALLAAAPVVTQPTRRPHFGGES